MWSSSRSRRLCCSQGGGGWGPAAAAVALVFLAIALGGHANSAEPRLPAILTDWAHLLAASIWIGGIAQIVAAWLRPLRRADRALRLDVMRGVLDRFGKVALPAFLAVAATGLLNALIQLGHPDALWESGYGRLLAVKVGLVGLVALASYGHAIRLRPRLLAANPHPDERLERRHWRLLRCEPFVAIGVVAAAAALVAFPLPPSQLGAEGAKALAATPCDPCPQRKPRPSELAVAEQAGSSIVAVWLRPAGGALSGELRLLDSTAKPVKEPASIRPAVRSDRCGPGCWRFRTAGRPPEIEVRVLEKGHSYVARLPARWRPREGARARRLLEGAQRTMRALGTVRESERVTSGPGSLAATRYQLAAPDRLAYQTNGRVESVVIGKRQWTKVQDTPLERGEFGAGIPFRTRGWFRWTNYARAVRLLGTRSERGRPVAQLALMDEGTPVWNRLWIDLATTRVLRVRQIAGGHFMNQRLFAFNRPLWIEPPTAHGP